VWAAGPVGCATGLIQWLALAASGSGCHPVCVPPGLTKAAVEPARGHQVSGQRAPTDDDAPRALCTRACQAVRSAGR
jgi:hypothetical protein